MADPLRDLRLLDSGTPPPQPDPVFATNLRARIERALALPRGVAVSTATTSAAPATSTPVGAAIPYLAVNNARAAIDWYVEVFGAELMGEPIVMPDGRIGHSELALAGGRIYLSDAHPEIGVVAPTPGEATVSLMLPVTNADVTRARVLARAGTGDREPYDGYGQRNAWVVDPFGHRWGLHSPLRANAERTAAYRHGDVGYVSLWVPDQERAERFYSAVLGWDFEPGGHYVRGTVPSIGVQGGQSPATLFCCYAVDDVDAAIERVRAAGGQPGEPTDEPWGRTANCTDNQGLPFAVYAVPPRDEEPPSADRPSADQAGDLGYAVIGVPDAAAARDFYAAVLGWTATPSPRGFQVDDTFPMIGISDGRDAPAGTPVWMVDDVDAAVAAVRDAGGEPGEPESQPYGRMAECIDDQGLAFYLLQSG